MIYVTYLIAYSQRYQINNNKCKLSLALYNQGWVDNVREINTLDLKSSKYFN